MLSFISSSLYPVHYSKFCNCFLICCTQCRHFFRITKWSTKARKSILSGGQIQKKAAFIPKKVFTDLFLKVAILYRDMKKSHYFQSVSDIFIFVPNFGEDLKKDHIIFTFVLNLRCTP